MVDRRATRMAAVETPQNPPYPAPGRAWYGVGVLLTAYTLSFVDRYVIALLVTPLKRDLQLSDTDIGWLSGFAFAIFYTTLGIPIGRLADRYSRRWIIAIGVFLWSLATMASGLARSYWQLFAARLGVGVGEASLSPAAFSMIADSFPPDRLGRALSVYSVGVFFGTGLAFIIGGAVIQLVANAPEVQLPIVGSVRAWQLTFFYVGLPGILLAVWMKTVSEPPRRDRIVQSGSGLTIRQTLSCLRPGWRAYAAHFAGFSLLSMVFNSVVIWAPAFLGRSFGLTPGEAGLGLGTVILVFGSTGILAGGWFADWLDRRGHPDATLLTGIVSAIGLTPWAILAPLMPSATLALWLYCPLFFFSSFGFGAAAAALQLITPNEMRGQVSAVYLFLINLAGIGLAPLLTAVITDQVFADESAVRYSIALVAGICAPLAAIVLATGLRPYRDIRRQGMSPVYSSLK